MTSLADAIIAKQINLVHSILQSGVDVNQIDEYGLLH